MSRIVNINNNKSTMLCFVCDQKAGVEKVNLASSISVHSKVTLPEKISQLIGDDFVVAVTEQDCVCKRCAGLLNHMDKLENELNLVKRALTSNISHKYKINFNDSAATPQTLANGNLKTDSASDYEDEGRKINPDLTANNASLSKKKPIQQSKIVTTPKPGKPAENMTKLKIYKCGFCSYQSKDLGNVRMHMKVHLRTSKPEADGDKGTTISSPMLTPKTSVPLRRRVFRCQVCSASFDDRNKCLDHISRDHTSTGRKLIEQKQSQEEHQSQLCNKSGEQLSNLSEPVSLTGAEQETENQELQQKEGFEDVCSQEEMDTADPPSIALYSCDHCSSTFDNDVDFANHVNEHDVKSENVSSEQKISGTEVEGHTKTRPDFAQISSQSEIQGTNDDEAPKDPNIGLDIEAMIAALHSEGPENAPDSMPNI